MLRSILVLSILAGAYYYVVVAQRRVPRTLDDFKDVSPEHYDRINAALLAFDEERTGRADIHSLSAYRATVSKHLYELKFRLPNDVEQRDNLQQRIDAIERDMQDAIQRIRKNKGKHLEFPYQLGDYFMHLEPTTLKQDQGQLPTY